GSLTPSAKRILDVASELFYSHGIHAVGVDRIAEESGVTKRTLYNNFISKDNLVATYLKHRHLQWWKDMEEQIAASPSPGPLALFDVYAQDALNSTRGCAYLNAAAELPEDHPAYGVISMHKRAIEHKFRELLALDGAMGADSA